MDYAKCEESLHYIRQQSSIQPVLGLICGSGLGTCFKSFWISEIKIFKIGKPVSENWWQMRAKSAMKIYHISPNLPHQDTNHAYFLEPSTVYQWW